MIKKFIIISLICCFLWGVIRQQNHILPRLKLANQINTTKIDNKEIIPNENTQQKDAASVEVDHAIIQTNAVISPASSINSTLNDHKLISITTEELSSNNVQWNKLVSPDAMWNARKFIITTKAEKHAEISQSKTFSSSSAVNDTKENTNESKQQSQSETQNNDSSEPNKIRCPLVEKIQQTAQKNNEAFFSDGSYTVLTHDPAFQDSNLVWLVGVKGIVAGSSDEAIYMAGIATSNINLRKNEYAEKVDESKFNTGGLFTFFVCNYGSGDIMAIGVWDKMFVDE